MLPRLPCGGRADGVVLGPRALQRVLIGRPLPTAAATEERLTRPRAIGAFGLDALSSVAYGPDEILYVLLLAGAAGAGWDIPIALAIAALLAIVTASYRQTIYAYPQGGGSFTVARENLGTTAGLVAAAALMIDYLTTVAVSVTAGVQAVVAFVPGLDRHRVAAGLACIGLLMLVNLRGVREAGAAFVVPTYLFVGSLGLLLGVGILRVAAGGDLPPAAAAPAAVEPLGLFLILRAFAGGCTAMTGIEAIANGIPVFKAPESRNAAATLTTLTVILGALFLGTNWLGHHIGAVPTDQANVVAQIGRAVATGWLTPLFYLVQLSAAVVLVLAANTSFNGFPLLAAVMAREGYFPHQFAHRGQRLAYSNGIVVIGVLAAVLVVVFGGSTHALIPLFAVGVFCCFTLSQAGMVRHWQRTQGPGWHAKLAVNVVGAVVTGVVTVIVVVTKFAQGAWVVLVLVPLLAVAFKAIHAHYQRAQQELTLGPPPRPRRESQRILVPVNRLNRAVAETLHYALSISDEVSAVHVAVDAEEAKALDEAWQRWGVQVPLQIVPSPFREVTSKLVHVIERVQAEQPRRDLTVMLPEVIPHRWWEEPLHNQTAFALELALRYHSGIVVTTVPIRLRR
jgi:amino acid transporter